MLKGLIALLVLSCAVAFVSADFSPFGFAGIYRDSRFGGLAYLCHTNERAQGSASGQLFFIDNRTDAEVGEGEGIRSVLTGNYYSGNAGKDNDIGTFELTLNENGDYSGWYWRKGKSKDAWPWVLTRLSRFEDDSVPSGHCLDSDSVEVPDLQAEWTIGSNLYPLQICLHKSSTVEGSSFDLEGDDSSYIYGKSYENGQIFLGRQYHAPIDTTPEGERCSDFGNAIYRVVQKGEETYLSGFITRGSLLNSPQIQYVQASLTGEVSDDDCDDARDLRKCETGVYFPELRSSASAVASSLFVVALFALVAVFF